MTTKVSADKAVNEVWALCRALDLLHPNLAAQVEQIHKKLNEIADELDAIQNVEGE